ncbi:hypothetical protein EV182_001474 [Spiromyces aspiralis]|uniref:Uncharacterized protein n=1 Tax=Spiromyces aspiralis TaxID=68401 RepID=A0ACC1HT13_9FUNG|nr:hypothetical protein EV182_001474 [Spiromyces aspiralis]
MGSIQSDYEREIAQFGWDPRKADPSRLPGLVVFDLDFTLWPLWVDTHLDSEPVKYGSHTTTLLDIHGQELKLYRDVPAIFNLIKQLPNTRIAVASRTHTPARANKALRMMKISKVYDHDGGLSLLSGASGPADKLVPLEDFIDYCQIYPGSKVKHFQNIHNNSRVAYASMLFFDDEMRNEQVAKKLGVTFRLVDGPLRFVDVLDALKKFCQAP